MADQQLTPEENRIRLLNSSHKELANELHQLGYTGSEENDGTFTTVDEMDGDSLFDRLIEFYELYPENIPNAL